MSDTVVLTLTIPPSTNVYWGNRVVKSKHPPYMPIVLPFLSAEAKAFKEEVALVAAAAGVRAPMAGRMEVAYRLYPHRPLDWPSRIRKLGPTWDDDVRCLDLDNVQKALLDALKGVVFEDDKWVRRIVAERMTPDEHGARLEVWVRNIGPAPEPAPEQLALIPVTEGDKLLAALHGQGEPEF